MAEFLAGDSLIVYLVIFFGKIIEISLDVVRIVMINRGQKSIGAFIGFFVIMIWLFIASSVLSSIQKNIYKGITYAVAYAIGNYLGVIIEQKLAIGLCSVQIIVRQEEGYKLANVLRENSFGVTLLEGEGVNYKRNVLILHVQRKRICEAKEIVMKQVPDAVMTVNDISMVEGGFMKKLGIRRR